MSSRRKVSLTADVASEIGRRAAAYMDQAVQGPHRDKHIARIFDCSVSMAKLLRRGQGWTAARLGQAARLWGWRFIAVVFEGPIGRCLPALEMERIESDLADLDERAARAREDLALLRQELAD